MICDFIFFIFLLIWKILASFLTLFLTAAAAGGVRLFWGKQLDYPETLRDSSQLRKGDIILTGKQSAKHSWYIQISNVLTRKLKHRFWTHAAIYQGNGKVWEAQPQGVIEKDVNEYFQQGFLVRAFRHRYIKEEAVFDELLRFCSDKKGFAYGTWGTVFYTLSTFIPGSFNWLFDNTAIDRWLNLDNAYFCSELVVDAFAEVDYPISPYDGWRVKPTDFISNPLLEPV